MLIGIGASIYSGNRYDAAISSANLAARFDAALGVTASGGFASAWGDRSGNGRNLLQATGANQPIHLPFAGTKYGWLPGVAGNYFSTPDSVAASITGDIDIRVRVALADWTPSAVQYIISKVQTNGQSSYRMGIDTAGKITYQATADGLFTGLTITATSSVATGFADGSVGGIRVTLNATTGAVLFYTSSDFSTWTQLGTPQSVGGAVAIFNGTNALQLGQDASASYAGQIYRAQIYNGIDGTLAVDFDPSRWTSGTTFTAATGETWTINSTGSKPAQIVDRPSLLFDGAAHFMKCNAFTLNQPETVYLVAKQVTWTVGDNVFDGNTSASMLLQQRTASPRLSQYAGSYAGTTTDLAVGTTGVLCAVFNGASSSLTLNGLAASTGDAGASNAGGFTLGDSGTPGTYANIQAYEALIYNVAHDAATRANVIRALMSKHGVA